MKESKYLLQREQLWELTRDYNLVVNAVLAASSDINEPFTEVRILTLRAYVEEVAYERASNEGTTLEDIDERASKIICSELTSMREFVEITPSEIRIGINSAFIDDKAISKALTMLAKVEVFTPGTRVEFEQPVQIYDNTKQTYTEQRH
jgi:hypothetical protein